MVFENLTLFEIQLDGAQFGSRRTSSDDSADEPETSTESSGRSRFLPVFFLMFVVGAAMLYRRSRSSAVEVDSESADTESDLAEAQ